MKRHILFLVFLGHLLFIFLLTKYYPSPQTPHSIVVHDKILVPHPQLPPLHQNPKSQESVNPTPPSEHNTISNKANRPSTPQHNTAQPLSPKKEQNKQLQQKLLHSLRHELGHLSTAVPPPPSSERIQLQSAPLSPLSSIELFLSEQIVLPEHDTIKIRCVITKTGKLQNIEILTASPKNREYLNRTLPSMTIPNYLCERTERYTMTLKSKHVG